MSTAAPISERRDGAMAVVVTGAGGMGLAAAHALAGTGTLVLVDVDEQLLEQGARSLAAEGARPHTIRCDVTVAADVGVVADKVGDLGGLRSLVHTVGLSPHMAEGRRVLEVDLVGTVRVLDALLPHAGLGSAAVCVASIAGYAGIAHELDSLLDDPLAPGFLDKVEGALDQPLDSATAYVLAKRGVMRACERLAGPWGERGARVVSIAPGLIDTEMGRLELEKDELLSAMVDMTPIKRPDCIPLPGRPADIAALVAFLCSDEASFISGCDIRVDGGLVGSGREMFPG
jgi:NAD(P)-dependent dehydrogenase (short-subunit alcohol dehydrogenase family)